MPSYLKNDVVLVRYPFSDLSGGKVRPAVIVNAAHASQDLMIVPLTSITASLLAGEFVLGEWKRAGLHVETVVKRGIYTVHEGLVLKRVDKLATADAISYQSRCVSGSDSRDRRLCARVPARAKGSSSPRQQPGSRMEAPAGFRIAPRGVRNDTDGRACCLRLAQYDSLVLDWAESHREELNGFTQAIG